MDATAKIELKPVSRIFCLISSTVARFFSLGDFGNIGEQTEIKGPVVALGFLIEVVEDVFHHIGDSLWSEQRLFPVDIPDLLVVDFLFFSHGADIFGAERKHVLVRYGVDDGVDVQSIPERLLRGFQVGTSAGVGVFGENRRPGEAEKMISFKGLGDGDVHVAELRTVALVKDDDKVLVLCGMRFVFLDED